VPDVAGIIRIAAIIFVLLLFPLGYLKGCSDEKEDYDAFKATVAAAGKAQEDRTKARIADDKKAKERSDRDYQERIDRLNNLASRQHDELQHAASSSIVPTVPAAPRGSGSAAQQSANVVCFARDRLSQGISAELSSFAERFSASAQTGASAIAGFKACATWAIEEAAKK
jgi:hypothetical protein